MLGRFVLPNIFFFNFDYILEIVKLSKPNNDLFSLQRPCFAEHYKFSCNFLLHFGLHSFQFPSLQTLGEDLITVLDFLHVKYVIGLGEGAGANVLARFGLAHPSRVLGLVLINATGSAASVLQSFKTKVNL